MSGLPLGLAASGHQVAQRLLRVGSAARVDVCGICGGFAHKNRINIIGDIPIFIAYDSADAWANPELFFLNEKSLPTVVAGVPPDYFLATGQLWGNPLYKWSVHKKTGYQWWIDRFHSVLNLVDIVRLDHFRGVAG